MKSIIKKIKQKAKDNYVAAIATTALMMPHIASAAEASMIGTFMKNNIHISSEVMIVIRIISAVIMSAVVLNKIREEGGLTKSLASVVGYAVVLAAVNYFFESMVGDAGLTVEKTIRK